MTENAKEAIREFLEKLKELIDEYINPLQEVFDEFTEKLSAIDYEERETYEPCYAILSPIPEIFSHKKPWRENRALFRPYKANRKSDRKTQRRVML